MRNNFLAFILRRFLLLGFHGETNLVDELKRCLNGVIIVLLVDIATFTVAEKALEDGVDDRVGQKLLLIQFTYKVNVSEQFVLQAELALHTILFILVNTNLSFQIGSVDKFLKAVATIGKQFLAELTELQIGKHRLHALHCELKAHNLSTQTGIETSIVMLSLSLTEDSLHDDCLLNVIGQKFISLLIKASLALALTVTKH